MAFVVEDGTGLAAANSYTSATTARAYWLEQGVVLAQADSAAPGVVSLQTALIEACRYMELRYRGRYRGRIEFPPTTDPVFAGQALSFPRVCLYDANGYPVAGVPVRVQAAQAEYMRRALASPLLPDPTQAGNLTMDRNKVGPIETEQQFIPGSVQITKPYPAADLLLREFLYSGNYSYR